MRIDVGVVCQINVEACCLFAAPEQPLSRMSPFRDGLARYALPLTFGSVIDDIHALSFRESNLGRDMNSQARRRRSGVVNKAI